MLPADQALVARENLIANLRMEHPVTRRVIDAIPLDKGDYSPDAVTKSAVDLAWHIVAAEHRFLDAVVTGVFNYGHSGRPAEIATSADISNWYARTFADDLARVSALGAEQLTKPIAGSCRCTCGRWARRCRRSTVRATTARWRRSRIEPIATDCMAGRRGPHPCLFQA